MQTFGALAGAFADLVDPRVARTKRHHLLDILTIQTGFLRWVQGTLTSQTEPVVAIDGKTVCRSGDAPTGWSPPRLSSKVGRMCSPSGPITPSRWRT